MFAVNGVSVVSLLYPIFYRCQLMGAGKKPKSLRWAFSIKNDAWECGHFSSSACVCLFVCLFW